jgi:SAM-dependent methyltransferase
MESVSVTAAPEENRAGVGHDREYVLGTHDDEVSRLALQHRVWRPRALDAWRRAGFMVGQTLLDLGCGPGHAAADLAEIVGPSGRVVAIDQSRLESRAGPPQLGPGLRQLFREVLAKKLPMRVSSSVEPQVGQVGLFSSRSRIVIVTENSF